MDWRNFLIILRTLFLLVSKPQELGPIAVLRMQFLGTLKAPISPEYASSSIVTGPDVSLC